MVPMLGTIGFGAAAVMIGSLFGPSQVLSRLINMTFGANLLPPMLATLSATLIVAGVVVLGLSGTWLPGAVVFAICLGLGSGINSIAQGSLPLWLFGSAGYGAITGRMAAARLAAGAMAPFVFSVLMERFGTDVALLANACLGAVGMGAFLAVASAAKRRPDASRFDAAHFRTENRQPLSCTCSRGAIARDADTCSRHLRYEVRLGEGGWIQSQSTQGGQLLGRRHLETVWQGSFSVS